MISLATATSKDVITLGDPSLMVKARQNLYNEMVVYIYSFPSFSRRWGMTISS